MKIVNAVRDMGSPDRGGSRPRFFRCDDDQDYLVKFLTANSNKIPINELVGISLALKLGLPTQDVVLVNFSEQVISLLPEDYLKQVKIKKGLHIGIKKFPYGVWDFEQINDEVILGRRLTNTEQLYGVISFDNWVLNIDRDNNGNNMIQLLPNNKMKFHMVDFGHCFSGPSWNVNIKTEINSNSLMATFSFILRYLKELKKFNPWCHSIEKFSDSTIKSIINDIPKNWPITEPEKNILEDLIKQRKHLVCDIIRKNKGVLNIGN